MINNLGVYDIVIDFNKMYAKTTTNIYYKEDDINTAKIKAKIVKNNEIVDLTGAMVSIKIKTSIDTIVDSVIISDAENGIIEYTFSTNAIVEGVNFFEIILVEGTCTKISPRVTYRVLDSINDVDSVAADTNYPVLIQLITDTNTVINSANQSITDIENKISEVENRCVIKENVVSSKITEVNTVITNTNAAKNDAVTATNNANTKITETEATRQSIISTINNLVAQFNALAPSESTNAEVQLARTSVDGITYASLQERLNKMETNPNIMWETVEG